MIRALLILVNVFFFWIAGLMSGDPTAEVTVPEAVKSGEEFTVSVKIVVNDAKDFMRFSMVLPEGFGAKAVETDDGKFLFEEQVAKVVWSKLDKPEMIISFKVSVPENASGAYTLTPKLSHLVDNLPAHIILNPIKIVVDDQLGTTTSASGQKPAIDSTLRPPVQVSVIRSVPNGAVNSDFFVDLTINKGDLRNFLKVVDSLPEGCSAQLVKGDGSNDFEMKDGVVTIRWYSLPEKQTLNVRYKVISVPNMVGTYSINGHISYVENETGKLLPIPPSSITFSASAEATAANSGNERQTQPTPADSGSKPTFQTNTNAASDAEKQQQGGVKTTAVVTSGNSERKTTPEAQATTNSATGVQYSVQIAAMRRQVPVSYYTSTYNISQAINLEPIDGLNKYTTGNFSTYETARNNREQLKSKGVPGPFVTAYSNGRRITVQEALMITSQQWVR